jgi:SAM-dependent methyltransferase
MRRLDRLLQRWRGRVAQPWILPGAKVLDIGCHRGEFLQSLGGLIGPSIGMDPLAPAEQSASYRLLSESFLPPTSFQMASFDVIVMLATLEHIPDKQPLALECQRLLQPGGRLIVTVPSLRVDGIIAWLRRLRLADGMSLEEHHGFAPQMTPGVFLPHGFTLEHARPFQLGFNHLFVFRNRDTTAGDSQEKQVVLR